MGSQLGTCAQLLALASGLMVGACGQLLELAVELTLAGSDASVGRGGVRGLLVSSSIGFEFGGLSGSGALGVFEV